MGSEMCIRDSLDLLPPEEDSVVPFTGILKVDNGKISSPSVTLLHNRSIAEDFRIVSETGSYNGDLEVIEGRPNTEDIKITGKSLIHTVPLTIEAFRSSFLGVIGEYTVSIGLVLFAFSTALAWSYYGDRAITYLFGVRWLLPYRLLYVLAFFLATISDTEFIWTVAYVTVALMTIPNLIAITLMHKEVKEITQQYWQKISPKP